MNTNDGVLETVVAKLENATAESEISIPDETVVTNSDIKDSLYEKSNNIDKSINTNKDKNVSRVSLEPKMSSKERKHEHVDRDSSKSNDNAYSQQPDRNAAVEREKEVVKEIICEKQEENNETYPLDVHTIIEHPKSPYHSSQLKDEDIQIDNNTPQQVAKLTRANLKQHTQILKESSSKLKPTHEENHGKEMANDPVGEVTEESINIANKSNASKNTPNEPKSKAHTESDRQNHNEQYTGNSESKETNRSITQYSEPVVLSPSKASLKDHGNTSQVNKSDGQSVTSSVHSGLIQNNSSMKKPPKSIVKRKVKKNPKVNLDDVETLVSREKCSKSENRKRTKKKMKLKESTSQRSAIDIKSDKDDSVVGRKNIEDNIDSAEKENLDKLAEHHLDTDIVEGPAVVHRRLLKRVRQRRFAKRPMYDATNTSTNMILLNNKYGENSRLWQSQENQLDRGKLINPRRHLKEPSFYLSGNFHSRCSTSESSQRYLPVTNLKFDFSDRPQSDKIGDRLYEAKMSVNQNRHRCCQRFLPPLPKPLDFSPPTNQERSNRYVFAWERLYAEPLTRPSTSVRPVSELSRKKMITPSIKIPQVMLTLPTM